MWGEGKAQSDLGGNRSSFFEKRRGRIKTRNKNPSRKSPLKKKRVLVLQKAEKNHSLGEAYPGKKKKGNLAHRSRKKKRKKTSNSSGKRGTVPRTKWTSLGPKKDPPKGGIGKDAQGTVGVEK